MIPLTVYVVDKLPRLPHLKIDRVRLAELDLASLSEQVDHSNKSVGRVLRLSKKLVATHIPMLVPLWHRIKKVPATILGPSRHELVIDEIICIFERVIGMKGINASDSVASAGGNSLHAVTVVVEIERKYHVALPSGFIEERRTIAEIAQWICDQTSSRVGKGLQPEKSAELKTLAAEITTSFEERRAPVFELGDLAGWTQAVNYLISEDYLDVAEHGLRHLRQQFPDSTYANRVGAVLDRLPWEGAALPFQDDPGRDVQVIKCDGAKTVILLFCDGADRLGLTLPLMHGWFGRLDASLVYLRDFHRCNYVRGISSFGATPESTLAGLRNIIASLQVERVVCYGNSSGVFGALSYALDLEADAALCMGGATNLSPEFQSRAPREQRAAQLRAEVPGVDLDLRRRYSRASHPTRVHLVFGQDYREDRRHAEHMAGLSSITIQPIENFDQHTVIVEVIRRGQFEEMLRWLVPAQGC